MIVRRETIRYGIAASIVAMIGAVAYAFVRLYIMNIRVDMSIFLVNILIFSISAGVLVYLLRQERKLEEEERFRD